MGGFSIEDVNPSRDPSLTKRAASSRDVIFSFMPTSIDLQKFGNNLITSYPLIFLMSSPKKVADFPLGLEIL
jgi:hypothetical protein